MGAPGEPVAPVLVEEVSPESMEVDQEAVIEQAVVPASQEVVMWQPTGVERVWATFLRGVWHGVSDAECQEFVTRFRAMEFHTVREFQALSVQQLSASRPEWPVMTDSAWSRILDLRVAQVRARPVPATPSTVASPIVTTVAHSPAVQVVGLSKSSVEFRTSKILRQLLGLADSQPLPKPQNVVEECRRCVSVTMFPEYGVNPCDILQGLATQGVLQGLEPNSRLSYTSGINHWIKFCVMIEEFNPGSKPPSQQLKVSEDEVLEWMTLIPEFKTANSYKSHLKLVRVQVKAKMKKEPGDRKSVKWVCRKDQLLAMVEYCDSHGMEWLSILLIVSYTFQWPVYSEFFKIAYLDIKFKGMESPRGDQCLDLTVNRRKNRPYRHTLSRTCVCNAPTKKGQVSLGPKLCAVHRLHTFLQSDTLYDLASKTQSPQFILLQYIDSRKLNRLSKEVALAVGDPQAMAAGSHGMRRGYACDLALAGASLEQILEDGDWRSEAFRVYLESIRDQLHNRALVGMLGDQSDDEDE